MNLKDKEPELRDEVKNKNNDTTGIVIAKYPNFTGTGNLLDVRSSDDRIYYGTPAKLWEIIKINDE